MNCFQDHSFSNCELLSSYIYPATHELVRKKRLRDMPSDRPVHTESDHVQHGTRACVSSSIPDIGLNLPIPVSRIRRSHIQEDDRPSESLLRTFNWTENYTPHVSEGCALTHLVHSARQGEVPVLAVHVVRAGTGVVTEPDAVVLDDAGVLLRQLLIFLSYHMKNRGAPQ